MPGMTNAHKDDFINHFLGNSAYAFPPAVYFIPLTADPGESEVVGNEPAASGNRIAINFNAASGQEAGCQAFSILGATTSTWNGTDLTHWALSITQTIGAGVWTWTGALTGAPISYTPGQQIDIAADAIKCQLFDAPLPGAANGLKILAAAANSWLDHSLGTSNYGAVAVPDVSLHSGTPATAGNEWTGDGSYNRDTFTLDTITSGAPNFRVGTHSNALSFANANPQTLRSWGIFQGTQLAFMRDQGSDTAVLAGSTTDAAAGDLKVEVD